jgi:hypothetical protein
MICQASWLFAVHLPLSAAWLLASPASGPRLAFRLLARCFLFLDSLFATSTVFRLFPHLAVEK